MCIMLYTNIRVQEKPGGVSIKKCNMKKSLFIILTFFPIVNVLSQNTYVYEMSMSHYNVGYYYVEYNNNGSLKNDTVTVRFFDENQPCVNLHVAFVINSDTIFAVSDKDGIVYLDFKEMDSELFFKVIVYPTFDKIGYMEKCIYFWEWGELNYPEKVNVFVEHEYNSIVHIRCRKPLSLQEMDKIKQAVLNNNLSEIEKDNVEISVIEHL